MEKLLIEAGHKLLQHQYESIARTKILMGGKVKWSDPILVNDRLIGASGKTGVYRFLYKPLFDETGSITMSTKYIGHSKQVSDRRSGHKKVFLNEGKTIVAPGGTSFHSPCAQRMYEFDSKLDNWLFTWFGIDDTLLAKAFEDILIDSESPEFNNDKMAGV
tara:strand:- start:3037 stop:3519 length:483 start_codon:yes stop_codon:yes gene_type:complete